MAAVRVVVNMRVKPGKEAELFEALRGVKKHLERLGATFLVVRQAFGPEAGNIVAVSQHSGWDAFARVQSDPEFAQLLQGVRSNTNPPWDAFTAAVSEEVAL